MATSAGGKSLADRRRRRRRDSEDELSVDSDGGSEISAISDTGDAIQHDSHASDTEDSPATAQSERKDQSASTGSTQALPKPAPEQNGASTATGMTTSFNPAADTQIMTNGAAIADGSSQGQTEDFDKLRANGPDQAAKNNEASAERRRREQEEYKKRREVDPTFIPNRGNFFMHDPRAPDQRGFTLAPGGRGRGRGRGFPGGPFSPAGFVHGPRPAESAWTHDLHDSINEPEQRLPGQANMYNRTGPFPHNQAAVARAANQPEYRPYSFSRSQLLGNVQVRVSLPGMKAPIPFTGVPVKQHTRLPDHRPPLRRDKPVRISLPERPPRYIFPSQERSFIFIPRALRPNQQGYGRSRAGFGPSSRRTSAYGGSIYSPSVAASRRSSIARDIGREHMFSPTASISARQALPGRPVVRLPLGISQPASIASPAGSVIMGPPHPFPLPQTPLAEHYRDAMTMHQPRPQKTISVSGIDSPAALSMHAPQQQDHQPFENQLPHHVTEGSFGSSSHVDRGPLQPQYPYQTQSGTPVSHIPERAIHAQPFQPPMSTYGQPVYGQYAAPGYYYPQVPVFVPHGGPQAAPTTSQDAQGQGAMMAHESNGMVYYIDPHQMQNYPQQGAFSGQDGYLQTPGYTVPGAGGMMTPSPEATWFYPGAGGTGPVYYPPGHGH